MCRRAHGSAFSSYGRVPKANYQVISGEAHLEVYASSDVVNRSFCDQCGSSLLFEHAALPDFNFIPVGTLDDDPGARPEAHIFVGSKACWYEIEDDLPQHEGYPETKAETE